MTTSSHIFEFEGDSTQRIGSLQWKSGLRRFSKRVLAKIARVVFETGDLSDFQAEIDARNDLIARNIQKVAEGNIDGSGGRIGGGFWFAEAPVASVPLEEVPAAPVYAGDLALTLKVWVDGALQSTTTLLDNKPVRLGVSTRGLEIEYQLQGNVNSIKRVDIASTTREIRQSEG